MRASEERALTKLRPEESALVAGVAVIGLGHLLAWAARRVKPVIDRLASNEFQDSLAHLGEKLAAHSEAVERHSAQIAREFQE